MYAINNYLTSEYSGASLLEALDRYKRYERKLDDQVRPSEDTLRKLSNAPFKIQPSPSIKTNFNLFPNGERNAAKEKDVNNSSDLLNDDDYLSDSTNGIANNKSEKLVLPNGKKTLPSIGRSRTFTAYLTGKNAKTKKSPKNTRKYFADNSGDEDSECEDNSYSNETKHNNLDNNEEISYSLSTVLKYLEQGYFLSRIQIRIAFALYLFKIQVRLFNESQAKDESNIQQMDLVLRFIKKASPNLTQEFKVYVPSKRLPICEQKRMLSKQLHDFLHIYKKDTELIRLETNVQIDRERKKSRNKTIDDKAFQALLYKSSESDLEEIMSSYMKNSHDSSIFLGSSKNSANGKKNLDLAKSETRDLIEFKLRSLSRNKENGAESQMEEADRTSKKTNDDDVSQHSFDSRSDFSKSSDFEGQSRSRSRSLSPVADKRQEKFKKQTVGPKNGEDKKDRNRKLVSSKSSNRLAHFDSSISSWKKDKPKVNKALDYHTGISNIYLQSKTKVNKIRPKTNHNNLNSSLSRTKTFHNSSASLVPVNKLTPLT
ncbi:tubulin polyglutamylase TTLL5-like isoform X4, partial [Brachionus plicatilis]